MRVAVAMIAAATLLAACGGDDDDSASGEPTDAPYDISVGQFIAELQPEKQEILEAFVADSKACAGVDADNGFVLLVSAAAIDAGQSTPLAELVEEQC
jgi:hypothetical protein